MGERKCQVWQLAVGGDSNPPPHLHIPCLPGGGRPGGGLVMRTYEGGCRSACSGSVRHPVKHFYPAGRMKKWFFDTKEWFWDGIFVMKTKNPQKSASHYCLPFPRPTMRLPRSCNSRLVEVHHVHPPPPMVGSEGGVPADESGDGIVPPNAVKVPPREGSEPQTEVGSDPVPIDSKRPDSTESPAPGDVKEFGKPRVVNQPQESDHPEKVTLPDSGKVGRISHVNVTAGSPAPANPGEVQLQGMKGRGPTDHADSEFTYVNYRASSRCSRFCRRRCCQGTGWFPCIPAQWKFLARRGVVCCFIRTASACLCLSSTCAAMSFCFRNVARNVDSSASTAVDVKELVNCYIFVADMPGLNHSEIKVQVENDSVLKLSGDRTPHEFSMETEIKYVRLERNPGRLMRKFSLPADTNLDGISAACEDGLLTVIVPKIPLPDPYRPRSFDVDVHSPSVAVSPPNSNPV